VPCIQFGSHDTRQRTSSSLLPVPADPEADDASYEEAQVEADEKQTQKPAQHLNHPQRGGENQGGYLARPRRPLTPKK